MKNQFNGGNRRPSPPHSPTVTVFLYKSALSICLDIIDNMDISDNRDISDMIDKCDRRDVIDS